MKRRSHAKRRDANEPEIVKVLVASGASVKRVDFLDLLVGRHGRTYLLEVKDGRKAPAARPLTDDEIEFMLTWRGDPARVVRCTEEALCVVGAIDCRERDRQSKDTTPPICGCGGLADPDWFTLLRATQLSIARDGRALARKARKGKSE